MLAALGSGDPLIAIGIVVVAVVALRAIVRGLRRRPAPSAPRRRPPATTKPRCRAHQDKVEFATERDAQEFVNWTRERYAAGRWTGKPMDHSYRCPVAGRDHWHVSSKPRRP
jgi:hypothetical protein